MFKNNEIKHFSKILIVICIALVILNITLSFFTFNTYSKKIINNNAYIINNLVEKHPELERDIIESVLNASSKVEGDSLLAKYDIKASVISTIASEETLKSDIIKYNLGFIIIVLLILITSFYIFIHQRYKAVNGMSKYIDAILNDNYNMNIRDYTEGDLSNLKNDIYKVTVKLKEYSDSVLKDKKYLEETLSDISHQLKTPLTGMYVINDILEQEKDEKIRKDFVQKNKVQLERIEWLISSLLKISRLDSGTVLLKCEEVNSKELVNTAIAPIQIPIELKNVKIIKEVDNFDINVDKNWSVESLVNIIKNAYEHTKEGGYIKITASDNPIYSQITIEDNGEGISKKDLPNIFKRFYKGSSSKESIGIGLNMAKKIIDMQNGMISVESTPKEGTKFTIKFYKNII